MLQTEETGSDELQRSSADAHVEETLFSGRGDDNREWEPYPNETVSHLCILLSLSLINMCRCLYWIFSTTCHMCDSPQCNCELSFGSCAEQGHAMSLHFMRCVTCRDHYQQCLNFSLAHSSRALAQKCMPMTLVA